LASMPANTTPLSDTILATVFYRFK
jgi:hypothetical protein